MKIRKGFVSNSSSSSFIIAVKDNKKELTKDMLIKALQSSNSNILDKLASRLLKCVTAGQLDIIHVLGELGEKNIEDCYYEKDVLQNNKAANFYIGSCEDQDSFEEAFLCELDIDYSDDDIVIKKEGSY